MSWPDGLQLGSIGEWPGTKTRNRLLSQFSANFDKSTLPLLRKELSYLGAKDITLLIDMDPSQFKINGEPRAQAVAQSPAVIISFDSKFGHLSYPCDTYTRWQDNVRAIAVSLEALRRVDRHGVTKRGEQYQGFLAIEAPKAGFLASIDAAVRYLEEVTGTDRGMQDAQYLLRRAQRKYHPDIAGDAGRPVWDDLQEIEVLLRANGLLS